MRTTIALLLLLGIAFSCNPVKKVLNDPVKMNEVAEEMVRRGYCSNDTTIITQVTDTFFIKEQEVLDTLVIYNDQCSFDTVLSSGTRVKFDNGVLAIREKVRFKTRVITNQVDNYIKDNKLEQILKKDIEAYKDTLLTFQARIDNYKERVEELNGKLMKTNWYLIAALVFIGISLLLRVYKFFKPLS